MKYLKEVVLSLALFAALMGCSAQDASPARARGAAQSQIVVAASQPVNETQSAPAARNAMPVIHVFVALCDNINQGIVPVSARLGNGEDPANNLYWGAAFGVKTFFSKSKDWKIIQSIPYPQPAILERLVFRHAREQIFLVADAYRGSEIKQATVDFLAAASGSAGDAISVNATTNAATSSAVPVSFHIAGSARLVAYVGHDGLMDFRLSHFPQKKDDEPRDAIILACASKNYFAPALRQTGATPLLWTTNLMAPEAYILERAIDGWIKHESGQQIRTRAADVYHKYQNCGLKGAMNLFATGY